MIKRDRRRAKIRKTIQGTVKRPRLVIFRSNKFIYGQLIDDAKRETLISVNKSAKADEAGKEIAEKALKAKITTVVFDRAGYQYHGNIKKFADAARVAGLKF